jgi:deazaflavin-dependent oxidoreductase (nitroreductase family)
MPTDAEFLTRNREVIAEYRATAGQLAQMPFPVLLLTTTGARTGLARTSPLGYVVDGGTVFVVGSRAGTPRQPSWYRNLLADPAVTVELNGRTYPAKAVVAEGAERDRLFALARAHNPLYAQYDRSADRVFPVVVLEGVPAPA